MINYRFGSYWNWALHAFFYFFLGNDTEEEETEHELYMAIVVYHKTQVLLTNLQHFQVYSIDVIACHEDETKRDQADNMKRSHKQRCSNRAIATGRTLPMGRKLQNKRIMFRSCTWGFVEHLWSVERADWVIDIKHILVAILLSSELQLVQHIGFVSEK